jgi:hypothetical protein
MNIRLVIGEMLIDPNRVLYIKMNIDVEVSQLFDIHFTLRLLDAG